MPKLQLVLRTPELPEYHTVATQEYDGTMEGLARALEYLANVRDRWADCNYFPPGFSWGVVGLPDGGSTRRSGLPVMPSPSPATPPS